VDPNDLRDPKAWWDAGYNRGLSGEPIADVILEMRAYVAAFEDWQLNNLHRGHAYGCQDLVTYVADMSKRADGPAPAAAPF
jgi:hypothetical protein